MSEGVIRKLQERFVRDRDALKRVLHSFGIINPIRAKQKVFPNIFRVFPETPVKMLKDVFEALELYDLLELLEIESMKPHRSLQLAYTLDEIKKLNGVADRPTAYHSCGAVLIITDDENVPNTSKIKTLFTDLDNKSDVTEVIQRRFELSYKRYITTLRHLKEEINGMILEIESFRNLLKGEKQRQTVAQFVFLQQLENALHNFKLRIQQEDQGQPFIVWLIQLKGGIDKIRLDLNERFENPSEGKRDLRQTDEFNSFLPLMMDTVERMQENLTQLIQGFVKEEEKEEQNVRENVSAVINRWIHNQG